MPNIESDASILLHSVEFYLFLAIIFITVVVASIVVYCCQRQNSATANQSSGKNRRSKIVQQQNGKKSKKNGNGIVDNLASDATLLQNPLVPRHTTAPGQGTADRPPPPLPPKFSRNAQLYQNLGAGITHSQTATAASYGISTTAGLPTVEVLFLDFSLKFDYFFKTYCD